MVPLHIYNVFCAKLAKKQVIRMRYQLQNNSSKIIGKFVRQFILKKQVKEWSREHRKQVEAATVINRNAKITIAKMKAAKVRFFKDYVRHINLSAAKIQGLYRGFYGRHYEPNCSVAYSSIIQLRLFLAQRKRERAATIIQKTFAVGLEGVYSPQSLKKTISEPMMWHMVSLKSSHTYACLTRLIYGVVYMKPGIISGTRKIKQPKKYRLMFV